MKNKFKFKFFLTTIICLTFLLVGCGKLGKPDIPEGYWGTWIRLDTGDEIYVNGNCVQEYNSYWEKWVEVEDLNIKSYKLDGDNILQKDNIRYFKKSGNDRSFSLDLAGFENTVRSVTRGPSLGYQNIIGNRENRSNHYDTQTVTPNSNGKLEFTNAIAGDRQRINIKDKNKKIDQSITVNPSYDGEDMGSIPLVEKGKYAFKVTYSLEDDDDGLGIMYANTEEYYTLTLKFQNISDVTCITSVYDISCDDPNLRLIPPSSLVIPSLKPNYYIDPKITVKYDFHNREEEFIDVPINIKITSSEYPDSSWLDRITIRFYKEKVPLYVNARNLLGQSYSLKGFIMYPDGRSQRFTVTHGCTETIYVPWSKQDYILAFSGADYESEMFYSFRFRKENILDITNIGIPEINNHEPNNYMSDATDINSTDIACIPYNDVDLYRINNSELY